jgi:hypothetical protein
LEAQNDEGNPVVGRIFRNRDRTAAIEHIVTAPQRANTSSSIGESEIDQAPPPDEQEITPEIVQAEAVDESIMHELERLRRIEQQPVLQAEVVQPDDQVPGSGKRRVQILSVAAGFLSMLGVVLGLVFGLTNLGDDDSPSTPTTAPSLAVSFSPTRDRTGAVVDYINNITLSSRIVEYPLTNGSTSPTEELVLEWLIDNDPLRLTAESASDRFRLRQRYALATLYFQSTTTWDDATGWLDENECGWYGVTCIQMDLRDNIGTQAVVSQSSREPFE